MARAVLELRKMKPELRLAAAAPTPKSNIRGIGWWLLVLSLTGQILSFGSLTLAFPEMAGVSFWMFAPTALLGLAMWLTGIIEDRLIKIADLLEARLH